MTFGPWLHSPPVVRMIVAQFAKGQDLSRFLAQTESYVEGTEALHAAILLSDPRSVARAIQRLGSWDLIPGDGSFLLPQRPDAAGVRTIVPFQGYRGKAGLLEAPPSRGLPQLAAKVRWGQIYEKDQYTPTQSDERIIHVPALLADRGALLGAWAEARLPGQIPRYVSVVLHRSVYDATRQEWSTDWADGDIESLPWYGPRCAVHELAKFFPTTAVTLRIKGDTPSLVDDGYVNEEIPPIGCDGAVQDTPLTLSVVRSSGFPVDPRAPRTQAVA